MTLVDFIDLVHDEGYVKVDVIDLSTDEDSVAKDGNVEEDDNVTQSENLAEAAISSPIPEQVAAATTSLSMLDHGSPMSSLMADKSMHPENQDILATSDVAKEATQSGNHELIAAGDCVCEAMQSEREAAVCSGSSMTEQAATTSLLLTKQGAITSSLKEDESMQSGNQVFVAALDCAEDDDNVPQSENLAEAAISSLKSEQNATATTSQGNTTMHGEVCNSGSNGCEIQGCTNSEHGGTHLCIIHNSRPHIRCCAVIECTKVARTSSQGRRGFCVKHGGGKRCEYDGCGKCARGKTDYCIAHGGGRRSRFQSENRAKAVGSPSMTERGATYKSRHVEQLCQMIGCPNIVGDGLDSCISHGGGHPHGEPGSSTGPCTKSEVSIKHAQEEPEGDTDKDENCDFEAETKTLSPHDKEKETSPFRKFYGRKAKKQVNISATECNRQLSIVHSKGVPPMLHNGDSLFSVMGNVCNGTASIGINVLDGEVMMSTHQQCSNTFQGNTTCGEVRDSGSKGCRVQSCTNGAHGGTPLCSFHTSRPNKRCCVVTGCTKIACKGSQGCIDCCVKHGGGKRCKYDRCVKGAQGNTDFCIVHGGGRRCKFQGCSKSAQGRTDYCIEHGGGRRCTFLGCSGSATYGKGLCSMHRTSLSSGNNSGHEMLPGPAHQAKKSEPSKRRNSHSVIGGKSQKRQNTNDYGNTTVETGEKKGRPFVCQNNMLKALQIARRINSDSSRAEGSPSLQLASTSPTTVSRS